MDVFSSCSVDDDLNVKVTDCALSRDLFPQDYCCLGDNENRPVKWMAVESLEQGRYTVASDVVSVYLKTVFANRSLFSLTEVLVLPK